MAAIGETAMQRVIAFVVLFACLLASGCGGGGSNDSSSGGMGSGSSSSSTVMSPAHFSPTGEMAVMPSISLTPAGGTSIIPTGSPLADVRIVVPAGALSTAFNMQVLLQSATYQTPVGRPGPVMHLDFGGDIAFNKPLSIEVPYVGDELPVPFYIDPDGNFHVVQITKLDRVNHRFSFETFHASNFTWVYLAAGALKNMKFDSGFLPSNDGFKYDNSVPSEYNRDGECFGMSSFSLWYFKNEKSLKGNLFQKYNNIVGKDYNGTDRTGQEVIATRAYTSVLQYWQYYVDNYYTPQQSMSEEERFSYIKGALLISGKPVILYIADSTNAAAHSIIATAVDGGSLSIYDVDRPAILDKIVYDFQAKKFQPYTGLSGHSFDQITLQADGNLRVKEPFEEILEDAAQNFHNSPETTIQIIGYHNRDSIPTQSVTLAGKIFSGQFNIERAEVYVNSHLYDLNMLADGSFSKDIMLMPGRNDMYFRTYAPVAQSGTNHIQNVTTLSVSNTYDGLLQADGTPRAFELTTPKDKICGPNVVFTALGQSCFIFLPVTLSADGTRFEPGAGWAIKSAVDPQGNDPTIVKGDEVAWSICGDHSVPGNATDGYCMALQFTAVGYGMTQVDITRGSPVVVYHSSFTVKQ